MPMDLFEGYYHNDEEVTIITILTGLAWYTERLTGIEERINQQHNSIQTNKSVNEEYQSNLSTVQTVPRTIPNTSVSTKRVQSKKKVSEILDRYKR